MSRRWTWVLLLGALGVAPLVGQEETPRWRLFGCSELVVDLYEVTGDATASPYRFEGTFWTQRLRLGLGLRDPSGKTLDLQLEGRLADNDYLGEEDAVLETLRFELEDGGVELPYRVGLGDLYADLSRRTLQRQIKGVSLEIQPQAARVDHSLLVVGGTGATSWEEAFDDEASDLELAGVSYLVAAPSGRGSGVLSFVDVTDRGPRVDDPRPGDRGHRLASAAAELNLGSVRLEGEYAELDPDRVVGDREDRGASYYGQLSQSKGALGWKLRYEDNDAAFVTAGAGGILPSHRIGELHGRYAPRGLGQLLLRLQAIEEHFDDLGPELETDVAALSWDGPVARRRPGLRLRLAAERNDIAAADGSRDELFSSYALGLHHRLASGFDWQAESKLRRLDSRLPASSDRESQEHSLTLGRNGVRGERRWRLAAGAVYREQRESAELESWSPVLDLSVHGPRQRLALHLSFLDQDFAEMTASDLRYSTQRLVWSWERGRHLLSLDLGAEQRRPDAAADTDSYRVTATWRASFDRAW